MMNAAAGIFLAAQRKPKLPYDAEVEYLESTGTQWIDTGVAGQSGIDMDFGFSCTSVGGSAQAIGGCWTGLQALYVGIVRGNGYFAYHYGNTNNAIVQVQQVAANTYYHVQARLYNGEQYYILNGNKSAVGAIAGDFVSPLNIHLFRINASISTYSNGVRIYALKIYVNGTLVRDFIPVRRGTVGYLYDRVSGKLFGNAGTGDFVLGPDVVPVEYIESHGYEWINTGVVPTSQTKWMLDAMFSDEDTSTFMAMGALWKNPTRRFIIAREALNKISISYGTYVNLINIAGIGIRQTYVLDAPNYTWHAGSESGTFSSGTFDITGIGGIYLFARNRDGVVNSITKGFRVYQSSMYDSERLVRSFRPVRVGTDATSWDGAMMDVLTRRVYRNEGSGAFTWGNDLRYPIPSE